MFYLNDSLDGNEMKDVFLNLFADADFAGCSASMKSTSGAFLALVGSHTYWPLGAASKSKV